ncbi:uncharacterized protein LOC120901063 [Anopheles arabiensis]|uniref:uncharacterized protein LOC120901063 n=1 Tax=Anopheles arabiensis TaxID=7173 RepID=UPI001AAD4CFD|nr:uncharacterized protein LOC120901063 [Anopheles arabiensis]
MDSLVKAVEAAVPDLSYLQACTEQLTTIAAAFERRHASLLETGDEVQWEEEEKRYDEFEQRRIELTVLLKRREAEMCVSNTKALEYAVPNADAQDPRVSNPKSKVRLPEIPLPNFDGALESWPTFRDAFNSMIDGHPGLSDVNKLIYLKRVASKEAAQVIDVVETKKVLVRRYLDDLFAISPSKRESYESYTILLNGFERTIKMVEKVGVCTNGMGNSSSK